MHNLRLSLCQIPLIWEDPQANRDAIDKLLRANFHTQTDLLVFPEMFTTGFSMASEKLAETMDGNTILWMKNLSDHYRCMVAGSLIIEEYGNYYNRLIVLDNDNQHIKHYDKKHLFTLAEEHKHFSAGNSKLILEIQSWKIGFFICYDLRFPVWCRNTHDLDLMVFVANFPEKRERAWNQLLCARAIENQCYVAGINRIGKDGKDISYQGDSAVYDFEGHRILHMGQNEGISTIELDLHSLNVFRRAYPFLNDRDEFEFI
ncbi:MAG: hypothetical protein IPM34_03985 [Saprospiraceae bacterium]|nr:hypothetical protein [Saprospiraceae bacterium]